MEHNGPDHCFLFPVHDHFGEHWWRCRFKHTKSFPYAEGVTTAEISKTQPRIEDPGHLSDELNSWRGKPAHDLHSHSAHLRHLGCRITQGKTLLLRYN